MNNFEKIQANRSEEWQDAVISIARDGNVFQQYLDVQSTAIHNYYTNRQLLQALVSKAPMKITSVDRLPDDLGARFNPESNELCVRRFMEFADTFQCMATELAHAELISGSDRQANTAFSAYSVAYILCVKYGVDTERFNFSTAPKVLEGLEVQTIQSQLSQICKVANNLSARMEKQLDVVNKAARKQEEP